MDDIIQRADIPFSERGNNLRLVPKASFYLDSLCISGTEPFSRYHYHDCYELCYVLLGEFYFFIKNQTFHVKKGDFILINAYDIHCASNPSGGTYKRVLINFKKDYLGELLSDANAPLLFVYFQNGVNLLELSLNEQIYIENLLESISNEYETRPEGYELYIKTALTQLLLFLNRHKVTYNAPDYFNASHRAVCEISAYINSNYMQDITLETISKQFYISPCHFSRTFKKVTGFSFTEYCNSVRIKEAQRLLRKTEYKIAEISEMVGYKSNTHFGRIFKSITGTSPLAYRNERK